MYYGVIDIGSTTLRLSVYVLENKTLTQLYNKKIFSRIIDYVSDNALTADGMDAIEEGIKEYLDELSSLSGIKIYCFAGAFIRNLTNKNIVKDEIYSRLLLNLEILNEEDEANYSFAGFKYKLHLGNEGLLIGVGGSSTCLTYFKDDKIKNFTSLDFGGVKKTQIYIKGIYPTSEEINQIHDFVRKQLESVEWLKNLRIDNLYSIGGNGRAVARIHRHINKSKDSVNEYEMPFIDISNIEEYLLGLKEKSVLYLNEVVPGRVNSFLPSSVVLNSVGQMLQAKKFIISKYGLREGFLLSKLNIKS